MRSIQEYERVGTIAEIVAAVKKDRDADWRRIWNRTVAKATEGRVAAAVEAVRAERDGEWQAALKRVRADAAAAAIRANVKLEGLKREAYDAGYAAGRAAEQQRKQRRVVERDDAGRIVAVTG